MTTNHCYASVLRLAVFEFGTLTFTFNSYPDSLPSNPPATMIKEAGMAEGVKRENQFLVFYGWIIYKDVFSRNGKESIRHETHFCYRFDLLGCKFVRNGPEEYNRYT